MGTLTLTELKDEVKRGLGNRSDMDDRLTRFLNLAQERVSRLQDFEEMQTATNSAFVITANPATDKMLSLPNLRELYSFRILADEESVKLKQVSTRLWDKIIPEPEYFARDIPTHYTIWSNQAEIWPVPREAFAYAIRWTRWPTAFSDSTPTATSEYRSKDELLIALALGTAFDSLGKVQDADRKYKLAGTLFLECLRMDSTRPDLEMAPAKEVFPPNVLSPDYWRDPFVMGV